jgi:hypothetical protein
LFIAKNVVLLPPENKQDFMTSTEYILQFAAGTKQFSRKELFDFIDRQNRNILLESVSKQIDRMLKDSRLIQISRGVYSLHNSKNAFVPTVSGELYALNEKLKRQFPFAEFCLWNSNEITPFMHHIPLLKTFFVEVERDVLESVFNYLNEDAGKRVFLTPSSEEYIRYINGNEAYIVKSLISESPLQMVENIKMPSIEKILVDVAGDIDFEFVQGRELEKFYSNVLERMFVNKCKLMRYAARRNRKKEVEQLYNICI